MAEEQIESLMRRSALLAGKRALVTGAAAGLGRSILKGFAAAGAHGLAFDLRPGDRLPEGWIFEAGDVGAEADLSRGCRRAAEAFGGLDILVANAGIVPPWRDSESVDLEEWDRVFAVNARGAMAAIKHAVPLMRQAGGAIIVMASVNALTAHPRQAAYTASKHAVLGIARAAARDLGRYAIRVNALAPGPVATGALLRRLSERAAEGGLPAAEALARYADTPLGRMATADEVASAAVFLASGLSSGITGQILAVDAGATP
jgi:NAD(P)-dependent dehydrogenase (short-subunit alcohol dehydrogenase family)